MGVLSGQMGPAAAGEVWRRGCHPKVNPPQSQDGLPLTCFALTIVFRATSTIFDALPRGTTISARPVSYSPWNTRPTVDENLCSRISLPSAPLSLSPIPPIRPSDQFLGEISSLPRQEQSFASRGAVQAI